MKSILMNKNGQQLNFLLASIISLTVASIILVLGVVMMQEFRDAQFDRITDVNCNSTGVEGCGYAYEGANATLLGLGTFSDFWEIIVLAIVAAVVVGIVLLSFARSAR